MDKTLEIVLAAVVISVTGVALLFALNGQSGDFTDFLNSESQGAQCDLEEQKYRNTICEDSDEADDIKSGASENCETGDWPSEGDLCS